MTMLSACGYEGARSLPLPGAIGGEDTYRLTVVFSDATNLVPKETCRANDTVVGSVESVELDDQLNATVVCLIRDEVEIPGNAQATLRETSLLGERYVALDPPSGKRARGTMEPDTVVPASETLVHPNTEIVFAALSQVLNGSSLGSIQTITREINIALEGRTGDARSAARRLTALVSTLDRRRDSLITALEAMDRLSGRLARQRDVIDTALLEIPGGVQVLDNQRERLVTALQRLSRLSQVAVPLIRKSRANTVADLKHLQPVLTQLNRQGEELAETIERVVTFPFPGNALSVIKGDYAGMYGQIQLDIDTLNKFLQDESGSEEPAGPDAAPVADPDPARPAVPLGAWAARGWGRRRHRSLGAEPAGGRQPRGLRRVHRPRRTLRGDRPRRPAVGWWLMLSRQVRIQLVVFAVVTALAVLYGARSLLNLGELVKPPMLVEAQFASSTGVHPRADVDLMGVRVGRVEEIKPGPERLSTVVLAIDQDAEVPSDVSAEIISKSAIGEGVVVLTAESADGPEIKDGDTIPLSRTTSPPDFSGLLTNFDDLVDSVDTRELAVALEESALAVNDLGPTIGRLLQDSHDLARTSVQNVDTTTQLIRRSETVLDTQVALGGQTRRYLRDLSTLFSALRRANPSFEKVFVRGVAAGEQIEGLLQDNREALPVLLNNLVTLTTIGAERIPSIRKTLVVFPWLLEQNANTLRFCDEINAKTGKPVKETCHYDSEGKPIYSAHLAQQLTESAGDPPYHPCTEGYGGTKRYEPNGDPVNGEGGKEKMNQPANRDARCTAPPTDPDTPNVRGSQNVVRDGGAGRVPPGATAGVSVLDPTTGTVASSDGSLMQLQGLSGESPPSGPAGLGWLLTASMLDR